MVEYRWNLTEFAVGYDEAAAHIHPYYGEIQQQILAQLEGSASDFLLVDAGGGSGRLVELFLDQFGECRAILVDQSESFLDLARQRLARFGERANCQVMRLQDDWGQSVGNPDVIVSMSAIHHLDATEKRLLFERCYSMLAPGGTFLNGDEIRSADDSEYLQECQKWAVHMHEAMDQGLVAESMCAALLGWEDRNVKRFGEPRSSGDDCHETVEAQCGYLSQVGFSTVEVPWQRDMWALFKAVKS